MCMIQGITHFYEEINIVNYYKRLIVSLFTGIFGKQSQVWKFVRLIRKISKEICTNNLCEHMCVWNECSVTKRF